MILLNDKITKSVFLLIFLAVFGAASAQDSEVPVVDSDSAAADSTVEDGGESEEQPVVMPDTPPGFNGIMLGMDRPTVSSMLFASDYFAYRGEPDVVFTPVEQQPVIRCRGKGFINKAFFYFQDEQLFSIVLILDSKKLARYTLLMQLSGKYGRPVEVTPQWTMWENEKYQISIENPLSVKYLDKKIYQQRLAASEVKEADRVVEKEQFLQQF